MPRQRNRYSRRTYVLPEDFPQRLKLFQGESGLSWSPCGSKLACTSAGNRSVSSLKNGTPRRCNAWPTYSGASS